MFKLPHQQDTEPGDVSPLFIEEADVFPKMHPPTSALHAWATKATTKKPSQKIERIEGCWSWGLAECSGETCSSKFQELGSSGLGKENVPPASKRILLR
jgi:hypothetical protein